MSWARLDDGFAEHPKVIQLSDAAFRTHVAALCYAARNLTNGHVSDSAAIYLAGGRKKAVRELLEAGCWETNGADGYLIHDYLEFNPSRSDVEDERERKREAGREGARKRWQTP